MLNLLIIIGLLAVVIGSLFIYKYKKTMRALQKDGINIDNVITTYNYLLIRYASDAQWKEFDDIVKRVIDSADTHEVKTYLANLRDFYNARRAIRVKNAKK